MAFTASSVETPRTQTPVQTLKGHLGKTVPGRKQRVVAAGQQSVTLGAHPACARRLSVSTREGFGEGAGGVGGGGGGGGGVRFSG